MEKEAFGLFPGYNPVNSAMNSVKALSGATSYMIPGYGTGKAVMDSTKKLYNGIHDSATDSHGAIRNIRKLWGAGSKIVHNKDDITDNIVDIGDHLPETLENARSGMDMFNGIFDKGKGAMNWMGEHKGLMGGLGLGALGLGILGMGGGRNNQQQPPQQYSQPQPQAGTSQDVRSFQKGGSYMEKSAVSLNGLITGALATSLMKKAPEVAKRPQQEAKAYNPDITFDDPELFRLMKTHPEAKEYLKNLIIQSEAGSL